MKIAVLISGRGSNLKSIIDDSKRTFCPYKIEVVIADKNCEGLNYAYAENIPVRIVNYKGYTSREEAESQINITCNSFEVDLIVLAGYMKVLTPYLVNLWTNKIVNIHPALLPSFPGLHTHERALEAGVKFHGVTVHFVDEGTDTGPIIAQRCVPVWPTDDEDTLASRVLVEEHDLFPRVIRKIALNQVACVNSKVVHYDNDDGNI